MKLTSTEMTTCYQVKIEDSIGTAFLRGSGTNTYFVTAAHVLGSATLGSTVNFKRLDQWLPVTIDAVWKHPLGYDAAVFTTRGPRSNPIVFNEERPSLAPGDPVKFLGFPHGLENSYPNEAGFSTPLVRNAFFSGVHNEIEGKEITILDGFNNPGYSGGPVYALSASGNLTLLGVISGYLNEHVSHSGVFMQGLAGEEIKVEKLYVKPNSGMISVVGMGKLLDLFAEIKSYNVAA